MLCYDFVEFPTKNFIFNGFNTTIFFDEYFNEIEERTIEIEKIWPYKLATNIEKDRLYVSDRSNYKILVFNENFDVLNSWNDETLRRLSLVDGLCFNNNRLYLTDSYNNQIIVFEEYDEVNKFPNFDGHKQKLKIEGYSPLDIKVHSVNEEETMVCVICFDFNRPGRLRSVPIVCILYDYELLIYKLKKEHFGLITHFEIQNVFYRDWFQRHFFFYHSKFYQICFHSQKIILFEDYGQKIEEIQGLEDVMKEEDINFNKFLDFANVISYQNGLLFFIRSKGYNIESFYESIILKIVPVHYSGIKQSEAVKENA